jgi:hypothetical protein
MKRAHPKSTSEETSKIIMIELFALQPRDTEVS